MWQARMYGLYVFSIALMLHVFNKGHKNKKNTRLYYLTVFICCLLILFTHSTGSLYVFSFVLTKFIIDFKRCVGNDRFLIQIKAFDIMFYCSVLLSWIVFFTIWLNPTLVNIHEFNFKSWIPVPGINDLYAQIFTQKKMFFVLITLILFLSASRILKKKVIIESEKDNLLLLGFILATFPILSGFIVSTIGGTSIFLDRYFTPSVVGWCIIISYLADHLYINYGKILPIKNKTVRFLISPILVILINFWFMMPNIRQLVLHPRTFIFSPIPGKEVQSYIPHKDTQKIIPIICEVWSEFLQLNFYRDIKYSYYFLINGTTDISNYGVPLAMFQTEKNTNIEIRSKFLAMNDNFYIIKRKKPTDKGNLAPHKESVSLKEWLEFDNWFKDKIVNGSRYHVESIRADTYNGEIYYVSSNTFAKNG
ncbi:hypothetical protein [Armatimonas sp.]|uniref:hypothetical protein n=1 Tax=Armatimonas sp. TaxID=1872638 RepID=UPI003752ED77